MMTTNPVKMFAFVGLAAIIAAGVLSQRFEPTDRAQGTASSRPAQPAQPTPPSSRSKGLFDNMEFRRSGAAADPAPGQPQVRVASLPAPVARGFGTIAIRRDANGHFNANTEIEGQRIQMLVDTGATIVALRHEDAQRLGINPAPSDFNIRISTANGEAFAARVTLREVRVENLSVASVPAVVMPAGTLSQSLLGMSFMNKLSKFEVADGELVMKQ